jgi:hypothetical protein
MRDRGPAAGPSDPYREEELAALRRRPEEARDLLRGCAATPDIELGAEDPAPSRDAWVAVKLVITDALRTGP